MKKRYTIMLDEKVIQDLKIAAGYMSPKEWRKDLEKILSDHAYWTIQYYEDVQEDIGSRIVREMREQNGEK